MPLDSETLPALRTAGYMLVWSFSLVAEKAVAGDQIQRTACASLRKLGERFGLQQACHLADHYADQATTVDKAL